MPIKNNPVAKIVSEPIKSVFAKTSEIKTDQQKSRLWLLVLIVFFVGILTGWLLNGLLFGKPGFVLDDKTTSADFNMVKSKLLRAKVKKIAGNVLDVLPSTPDWDKGKFKKLTAVDKVEIILLETVPLSELMGSQYQAYLAEQEKTKNADSKIASEAMRKMAEIRSAVDMKRSDDGDALRRQIDQAKKDNDTAKVTELQAKSAELANVRRKKINVSDIKEGDGLLIHLKKGVDGLKDSFTPEKIEVLR